MLRLAPRVERLTGEASETFQVHVATASALSWVRLLLVCPVGVYGLPSVGESILLLLAWFGFNDGGGTG